MPLPDYAGAKAAIRAYFEAAWAGRTPVALRNRPKPQTTVNNEDVAWVRLEIVSDGAHLVVPRMPGSRTYRYDGAVEIAVFVPAGTGEDIANGLAVAAGDIFRAKLFYNTIPGYYIRTKVPGGMDEDFVLDKGKWYGVAVTIPFEYWHRG